MTNHDFADSESIWEAFWEALDLFFEICSVPISECVLRSNIMLKREVQKSDVFDVLGGLVPTTLPGTLQGQIFSKMVHYWMAQI